MIDDPTLYLSVLVLGAFLAAFVTGAVGFADALILNAIWLHIMVPSAAIPLVVSCGIAMHALPLYKLRRSLDFSRLPPFLVFGVFGVPFGSWALTQMDPTLFRTLIGGMLIIYGLWMLFRPSTSVGESGGRVADSSVGLLGGFMGGFAGLSGLFPTLWAGLRGWPKNRQRGVYQPFVLAMHALGLAVFTVNGLVTTRMLHDLLWCLPAVFIGSWMGVLVYPYLNEIVFRRIILGLVLLSGISLLF